MVVVAVAVAIVAVVVGFTGAFFAAIVLLTSSLLSVIPDASYVQVIPGELYDLSVQPIAEGVNDGFV